MKRTTQKIGLLLAVLMTAVLCSCERLDNDPDKHVAEKSPEYIELDELVEIMTLLPISQRQLNEVHAAVTSSSDNGYDEEYMMRHLFTSPGSGVGDQATKSGTMYDVPMRDLISDVVMTLCDKGSRTRSAHQDLNVLRTLDRLGPEAFLNALESSDMQIYWPFSEDWDGSQMPIMTYDPEDGSDSNIGYRLVYDDDGFRHVEEVTVDEETAMENPVWVINRNDDSAYPSLEMLRREDPDWGEGGGNIIVKPVNSQMKSKSEKSQLRTLILRDFTMKRHYDTWFAGASEFFVKMGAVEDFTASTEAELHLYNPSVTDFMIVVRRNQIGRAQAFNAILISEFTDQLTHCAFMITEDDGGTITKWDCTAFVRVESRSYGVEVSLPFNSKDDIVWRGQLSSKWFENNNNISGHFGDVDLTFELQEN
jgi:hypothetical protein